MTLKPLFEPESLPADPVDRAIRAVGRGECVVLIDAEDRENEGDLILAAELATPETIGFMVRHTSGLLCVSIPSARADELRLPLMVDAPEDMFGTAFTVSVDARRGTSTGISAADRAATVRAIASPNASADDFVRPGHVFPLRASDGGVLSRPGHTEASLELVRLAGLEPAGVLAEIVHDDGSLARRPALFEFAKAHGLECITIDQLVAYLHLSGAGPLPAKHGGAAVARVASARLKTSAGSGTLYAYRSLDTQIEHAAWVLGDLGAGVLVRVHSECLTGDALGSVRCDCGEQLQDAQLRIADAGRGVIIYLQGHEGRGIGLASKVAAYALQDKGLDTVEANVALGLPVDARSYDDAAAILVDLGVTSVRLMTNNPQKCKALEAAGIGVERVPLWLPATAHNHRYLSAKQTKLCHLGNDQLGTLRAVGE
ncbi:3,4-dihydroxy-2-butanone-4-phosphate synthase [Mycobacterium palustre]|uniref:Multifunctional fusion protein n=2 Tax=Mycobacterium palustre TaxID=153971 RepID=A0A1X1ZQJ7_9MYCO|nr:3,4-dihydroxy-2-butanone-4-phosphate synthase [Mycobacterium palustre]MCV7103573.1 3,4-dihydroxy-2-butanone-4-phosphate synthase [Mycobacterium palustre]ORW25528.1 3,4-dihydroxy-2-butanone 4-phosphate synthase [Mycobacterium palustre]